MCAVVALVVLGFGVVEFGFWDFGRGDCGTETEPLIALIGTDNSDPVPSAPAGWISAIRGVSVASVVQESEISLHDMEHKRLRRCMR